MNVSLLRNRFAAAMTLAALCALSVGGVSRGASSSKPAMYQASQASAGGKLYAANCSACHGDHLEGGAGPALSGATLGTLAKNTKLSVGDMFSFLSLQMPLNDPASLKKDQYVAIMAYILKVNGYPAGRKALTYTAATNANVLITPASTK